MGNFVQWYDFDGKGETPFFFVFSTSPIFSRNVCNETSLVNRTPKIEWHTTTWN